MAFIGRCPVPLAFKYMTQVPTASCTCYFDPHSIWIWLKNVSILLDKMHAYLHKIIKIEKEKERSELIVLWLQGAPHRKLASHSQN